jgi:YVTN family beta-propeller protein
VANLTAGTISVIDPANNQVIDTLQSGGSPFDLALAPCPAGRSCAGDCDGNGMVSISELIIGVNISLERRPLSDCTAVDNGGGGTVSVAELIRAVRNSLDGCAA